MCIILTYKCLIDIVSCCTIVNKIISKKWLKSLEITNTLQHKTLLLRLCVSEKCTRVRSKMIKTVQHY
jgi:hypothetical protein